MSLQEQFDKAAEDAKNLKTKPSDDHLLELYSLYKQSITGDCNTEKPGFFDFAGKAKWEAWNARKGMSQDDAKKAYVEKVQSLIAEYGLN